MFQRPIRDVVRPTAKTIGRIANTAEEFVEAGEKLLQRKDSADWLGRAENFCRNILDKTWAEMNELIKETIAKAKAAKMAG